MSKSQVIRECVQENSGITKPGIVEGTGLDMKFVDTICRQRVDRGEFMLSPGGGYSINVDFVKFKKGAPAPRRKPGKKFQGNRALLRQAKKRQPRTTLADVARKLLAPPASLPKPGRVTVLAGHVQAALDAFLETIDLDSLNAMSQSSLCVVKQSIALLQDEAMPF